MEHAFKFVANAIGWASNRGAGERTSNTTTNYNNQFETNTNQHGNGYNNNNNNNNNTMSTSDIASKRTVETNTKRNGVGAIVGTTRRSRMFTASSISCSTRNYMNGTPQNNQSNNTKE